MLLLSREAVEAGKLTQKDERPPRYDGGDVTNVNKKQLTSLSFHEKIKRKQKMFISGFSVKLLNAKCFKHVVVSAATKNRALSTTVVKRDAAAKDDLVVDYLDGDRSGIVVFGLNRPAAKNSFSKNLVAQLCDAVEAVKYDKAVRTVILKSTTPGIFCAGADLKERAKMPAHLVGAFVGKARKLISDLENLPMPVIAAIDGHALGSILRLFFTILSVFLMCDARWWPRDGPCL